LSSAAGYQHVDDAQMLGCKKRCRLGRPARAQLYREWLDADSEETHDCRGGRPTHVIACSTCEGRSAFQTADSWRPTAALQQATAFGRYVRNTTSTITFDSMRGVPFHRPHAAPGLLVHLPGRGVGVPVRMLSRHRIPGGQGDQRFAGLTLSGQRQDRGRQSAAQAAPSARIHGSDDRMHDHRGDRRGSEVVMEARISSIRIGCHHHRFGLASSAAGSESTKSIYACVARGERRPLFPRSFQ
jgi:hypothetical protein